MEHLSGEKRRQEMLDALKTSREPISGTKLAEKFHVSRQVVVQDIALLRARNQNILSTNKGYILPDGGTVSRVFAVCHGDDQIEQELNTIVDFGGCVVDVFIRHEVYGTLRAELSIRSRRQVKEFLEGLKNGKSSPLKNITSSHHYHTVEADSEETLHLMERELKLLGILDDEKNGLC